MRFCFFFLFVITTHISLSQQERRTKIKKGGWISELSLNKHDILPFQLSVTKKGSLIVVNADEEILLEPPVYREDSFYVQFPLFNSELIFKLDTKKKMSGYWVNYNKGIDYKIPFHASRIGGARFNSIKANEPATNVDGKWKVEFEPNTTSSYPAIGIFNQTENNNRVVGTFLTETGDYRFLEGNTTKDSLYLSCFDGSHAFLFKAKRTGDILKGTFFSGSHWKSNFVASKNDTFKLTPPDELTYLINKDSFNFNFKTIEGLDYKFPNADLKDKVVIIQIMGSWCPNCVDEVRYYKELYDKYHEDGLEIISICYEAGKSEEENMLNIERLKNKLALPFTFLLGGAANKDLASKHFQMLNEVISFPTSIFLGRDGNVERIHTGFNGPGTGVYYSNYVSNTYSLIEKLLAD